jgi:hypothetical protein
MKKDVFGCHCAVRHSGFRIEHRVSKDISFVLHYFSPDVAAIFVYLVDRELLYFCTLFGFRLYFCLSCGRYIGIDNSRYESICWLCEDELREDLGDLELLASEEA